MTHRKMSANEFLAGAAVGSILGGVAALMMAPKAGKKLRQDLSDACCNMAECTSEAAEKASKTGKALAKSMCNQSHDWADKAKCMFCGVKKIMGFEPEEDETEDHVRDFLIGGAIGGVLGALTGLLIAPKPGSELREDLAGTYEDVSERTHEMAQQMSKKGEDFVRTAKSQAHSWINVAKEIIDGLTDQAEEKGSELKENAKNRLNEVADWASLGFRVWQEISKRK